MKLTDIRGLDHADVVTTIANAADCLLAILADEPRNVSLLSGRATTGDDCWQLSGEDHKLRSEGVQTELKGLSIDNQTAINFCLQKVEHVADLM